MYEDHMHTAYAVLGALQHAYMYTILWMHKTMNLYTWVATVCHICACMLWSMYHVPEDNMQKYSCPVVQACGIVNRARMSPMYMLPHTFKLAVHVTEYYH